MKHLLDNPIYNALNSAHSIFAKETENAKYYTEDIASFAGLKDNSAKDFEELYQISPSESMFIIFSPISIVIPSKWKQVNQINMFQMIHEHTVKPEANTVEFKDLNNNHVAEMTELVKLTQPGPFLSNTIALGNYTGIFKDKKLVAMAGHRFNPTPYTEISAVCTHPDHLGNGYANVLLCEQIKRILANGETPFLHVRNDNTAAIKLYEKLGFVVRTEMTAYVVQKRIKV
jgi:predicted GNAT family acetyltransferase